MPASDGSKDWDRKASDAITAIPCEEEFYWSRNGSFSSELSEHDSSDREHAVDVSKDWRPLTVLLRQALADAKENNPTAQVVPEKIDSQTRDWRPLATALRGQLAARQSKEDTVPCCPPKISGSTEDWRPSTTMLRKQLASMQSNSKMQEPASCLDVTSSICEVPLPRGDECPSCISSTTKDWRPLTVLLRQQLAETCQMVKETRQQETPLSDETRESCPALLSGESCDWRPLTVALRRQLAEAKLSEPELVRTRLSTVLSNGPAEVQDRVSNFSSEMNDWRPLTAALREQLALAQQKQRAKECPSEITCETLDWRRTTSMLREQLANQKGSKSEICVSPSTSWGNIFAILVAFLAFIMAFIKM